MKLGLIFTQGVSVAQWAELGLLDREKLPYERLGGAVWFTYGADDKRFEPGLRGIEIVPMPRAFDSRAGRLAYSLLLPWLRRRELRGVDVVKSNQMKGAWTAVLAAWAHGKRLVVRTGFTWSLFAPRSPLDLLAPLVERAACRAADEVQVTTESQRRYLLERYGLPESRVRVIPNFVDVDVFRRDSEAERQEDRVVFVGRLSEQKNLEALIEALVGTGLGLDLYGDGPLRARLESAAAERGVSARFFGRVPNAELPGVLNRYSLFVLPSLYEGFPKAALEAMACGLAVLAGDSPGNRELIRHGETGWLAPTGADGLRAALRALAVDPSLRARLGAAAAREAREKYSLDAVVRLEAHAR